ncbi:MAG: PASTA domain-containing protein [Janthinobacterium lividum]
MSTLAVNPRYEILEATPGPDTPPYEFVKARDREEGRVVALQVVPSDVFGTDAVLRRNFQNAVQRAQTLEHPGILRVFDQGAADGSDDLYVVREQLRGITLQERIRRIAPFTLAVSTDIAIAVTEAVVAAHRAGVAHGDLRPGHVLLSPEGQIKTADFAYGALVAAQCEEANREAYLAPELSQDAGQESSPTFAGDIYALGAMLYEMLTGVLPLAGGMRVSSPRDVNPNVPAALDGLVQKCLLTDPAGRYRTAGTLLTDLQSIHTALRTGKPLTWSPLTEKSSAKPSEQASSKRQPRPLPAVSSGDLPNRNQDPNEERYEMPEREPSSVLGLATKALFVIFVLGVIGLSWYATRFLEVPSDVVVPNLIGKTFDDAKRIAGQQHFTLVESPNSDYSDTMPEDQIYEQVPLSGHTIKADKEVTVYRSLGPRLLTVPALAGTTQDYAGKALLSANLPLGTTTQEYSATVPSGVILSQSPESGSKVARNTAVNFVVSKGKQPPEIPSELSGNATGPDRAELDWHSAPRAESYTVTRSLDGDTSVVAQALPGTHFTDTGLKPNTTYSYTVNAVNSAGSSDPSESVLVTTQASPDTQAVLPPDSVITPPADTGTSTDGTTAPTDQTAPPDQPKTARLRQFTIAFTVPRHPRRTRHVQIEVQDTTGTNLVYDENHEPGEDVSEPEQGFGNKITFRIFLDSKLVKQQTF